MFRSQVIYYERLVVKVSKVKSFFLVKRDFNRVGYKLPVKYNEEEEEGLSLGLVICMDHCIDSCETTPLSCVSTQATVKR